MADSALGGITDILTKVLPMITGSKSTQTESMQVDPASNAALQALLGNLTNKATGTAGSDELLASLLDKANLSTILPAVAQQQQAGLYKGNPLADITARAKAKAANDAMAAILQAQGQAGQSAAYLASNNQKANSTTKRTTATPGNPIAQALSIGATGYGAGQKLGLIGKGADDPIAKLIGSIPGKRAAKTAEEIISEGVSNGQFLTDGTPLDLSTTDLGGFGANAGAGSTAGASVGGEFLGAGAGEASGLSTLLSGDSGFFGSEIATTLAESGFGAAGAGALGAEAFTGGLGAEAFFGGGEALGLGFGEALGFGSFLGPAAIAIPIVSALVGDDSVICTEATKQGLMPKTLYYLETATYLPTLSPFTVSGYQFLAAPAVRWMQRSKLAARFFAAGACAYASHTTGYKPNLLGAIIKGIGEPVSTFVGYILSHSDLDSATVKV